MRTLIVIALLQTGLLLAIFGKIYLYDDTSADQQRVQPRGITGLAVPETRNQAGIDGTMLVDERLLRAVIREELAAYSGAWGAKEEMGESEEVYDPAVEAERQAKRQQVEQRIEYYSSVGSISDAEMQLLKSEIARLDPDSRRAMFKKLVRALNTGALDGRL